MGLKKITSHNGEYVLSIPRAANPGEGAFTILRVQRDYDVAFVSLESGDQQIPEHHTNVCYQFRTDVFDMTVKSQKPFFQLTIRDKNENGESMDVIVNHADDFILFTFNFAPHKARPQITVPVNKGFFL